MRMMTDEQLALIRQQNLALVTTLLDGRLLVRDPDGNLYELGPDLSLLPHIPNRPTRVSLADLPAGD